MNIHQLATSALAGLITLTATSFPAAAQQKITPPPELADLPAHWQDVMKQLHVPGLAVVVVKNGETIMLQALGHTDADRRQPVTPDSPFYIASCTKTFVAMAIMQLVEQGRVDLDTPVRKYLPRFRLADPAATNNLTVRDLLSHAKGLESDPAVWLDAYTGDITEDRYYHFLEKETPKGSFEYTNVHYTLAGRIIESVTGKKWQDYLAENIFNPAQMKDATCYADAMYARKDAAKPTQVEQGKIVPAHARKTDRTMHAAGGMGTSVTDLANWLKLNLGGGTIGDESLLSPAGIKQMQTLETKASGGPEIPGRKRKGCGLGWFVTDYKGHTMFEHGGGYIGTTATISILPKERIGLAVVANSTVPVAVLVANEILDRLLGIESQDILPMLTQMASENYKRLEDQRAKFHGNPANAKGGLSLSPDRYAGTYTNEYWGTVRVVYEDGQLIAHMGDLLMDLDSSAKDAFAAFDHIGKPQMGRFEVDANGEVTAVIVALRDADKEEIRFDRN